MRAFQRLAVAAVVAVCSFDLDASRGTLKFFPDDPLTREPETQDASNVQPWVLSDGYELVKSNIGDRGERANRRATSANTIDEASDSSWFTNRLLVREMSTEELVRGPNQGSGPAPGPLTIVGGKAEGLQPGFTVRDSSGQRYFVKFDPPSNPEMASGAEVISTKVFHALGYFVPENYLVRVRRESLVIGEGATIKRDGRTRRFTPTDLDDILRRSARSADGSYRGLASKAIPGRVVGPFRYHATRPDDPNDIVPHEHRRELRGLRVGAAWLNHHDVRSANSLDTVVPGNGRQVVRHYLLDFGATLGSGSIEAQSRRAGNEFLWEARPTLITMLTLGFYVRPWLKVEYPHIPAVGRIEADYFQPAEWKPDSPNPAFANARADDTFWAARRVAMFSDELIRAVVTTAEFTDPQATEYLTQVLKRRRDKVLRQWLTDVNPLVDFTLAADGSLMCRNAAVDARVSSPATEYRARWARFDNETGSPQAAGPEATSTTLPLHAPADLVGSAAFVVAEFSARHPDHQSWSHPVRVYFRRQGDSWQTMGIERLPETGEIQTRPDK